MEFSNEMKLKVAKRELAMRRKVYPERVKEGRMTKQQADFEIEGMRAIVQDYEKADASNAQLPLSD
jgi:hypothetical protein